MKIDESVTFSCPSCSGVFDFDPVEEYQFVACPICGTQFMTTRKGKQLLLESFGCKLTTKHQIETALTQTRGEAVES